VACLTVVCE